MAFSEVLTKINEQIIDPLIVLLFGLALAYFLWGGFEFVRNSDSDEGRDTGRRHMLWGIIGMFIMVAAWGIINLIINTFGL